MTGSLLATQTLPRYVPGARPAALRRTRSARDSSGATRPEPGTTEPIQGAPHGTVPSIRIASPLKAVTGVQAGEAAVPLGLIARWALRTRDGQPYRLFPLPWPAPILDQGRRLAASYANFLILNGAVLMPAYGDPADDAAAAVLQRAFPSREIVQVPCRPLIWQNGSLHCLTMQLPAGLV